MGSTDRQLIGAVRKQYEAEFERAFGVSPVQAAHLMAHFRDGYLGLLDELIDRFNIPPMLVKPAPNMAEDAPFAERYIMAGWVLPFLPEHLGSGQEQESPVEGIVKPEPTPQGIIHWSSLDPREVHSNARVEIIIDNTEDGPVGEAHILTDDRGGQNNWSVAFYSTTGDWAQDITADDAWPDHWRWAACGD